MQSIASFATALTIVVSFSGASSSARQASEPLARKVEALTAADLPALRARAAEGDAESQFLLGLVLLEGRFVPKDEKTGWNWLQRAGEQRLSAAELAIAERYHQGSGVRRDYREAMKWYLKAAEQGQSTAMNNIAVLYRDGLGVRKDDARALDWFEKAANLGNAGAMSSLAGIYLEGRGVRRDPSKAFTWYRKAAELGNVDGQFNVAVMYEKGRGTESNVSEAMRWFLEAARQGDGQAMNNLGYMYQKGNGVPQDGPKAVEWYLRAIENGEKEQPSHNLARMYQDGVGLPQDLVSGYMWRSLAHWGSSSEQKECLGDLPKRMTKEQVAEAEGRAAIWPPARLSLCARSIASPVRTTIPVSGPVPSCGIAEALPKEELESRAEAGDAMARCWLGMAYAFGLGISRNEREAEKWHRMAAEQGNPASQYSIGSFYEFGRGVPRNLEEAMNWYQKAAAQGLAQAQAKVGFFYKTQGRDAEAADWTRKAAEQGDLMAQINLAGMYAEGRGAPRDHRQSLMWVLIARESVCGPGYEAWKEVSPGPDSVLLTLRDQERANLSADERQKAEDAASAWLEEKWPGGADDVTSPSGPELPPGSASR